MRNSERRPGERIVRGLLVAVGVLAAFGAFDAFVFFVVLALVAVVAGSPGPYAGLLFVALPVLVLVGTLVAWAAWVVLQPDRPADRDVPT
ncbi:MAG TPA: hypothetical protein VG871_21005 [Vicinamibacterales bacterium]|nr:hypothetical protein [Vicinamibacterales bacterium]